MSGPTTAWKRTALLIVVSLVFLVLYTWAFHNVFTVHEPGAVDFYPTYMAARLYLEEDLNPYSAEASNRIQHGIFGAELPESDLFHLFFYPLYTMLLAIPFLLLPTYAWVQAAWQVTLQVLLIISVILTLRYFDWRPSPLLLAVLVVWGLFMYPAGRALLYGQLTIVVFFLTVLAFWMLFRGDPSAKRDILAGICLAFSTIKPQMQFLIIPLLVLWGLRARRLHFLASAALSMVALFAVSFLMVPTWLDDWLGQMAAYSGFAHVQLPVLYILTHQLLPLGPVAVWALRLLLVAWLLAEWWLLLRDNSFQRLDWVLAITLVLTHLLAPRTATYNYVVFIFALLPAFRRLAAAHSLIAVAVMLALVMGEWWLFLTTVSGVAEAAVMSVALPFVTLLLLLLARHSLLHPQATSAATNQSAARHLPV